jgi:hypothetical protein
MLVLLHFLDLVFEFLASRPTSQAGAPVLPTRPSQYRTRREIGVSHPLSYFHADPALKLSSPSTIGVDRLLLMRACAQAYIFTFTYT